MLKYIAGIITGTTITIIGWDIALLAVVKLVMQIIDGIK